MSVEKLGLRYGEHRTFGSRILGLSTSLVRREVLYVVRSLLPVQHISMLGLKLPVRDSKLSATVRRSIRRENYERPELAAIVRNLRPDDRVLECGAGIGAISATSALIVGSNNVVAVEADPRMRDLIEKTWKLNGVSPTLLTGFVTDIPGEEEITVNDDMVSTGRDRSDGSGHRVTVPRLPLAGLLAEWRPTVIIMDVEGAEVELLTLEELRTIRMICVEVHPHLIGNDRCLDLIIRLRELGLDLVIDESSFRCLVFKRA